MSIVNFKVFMVDSVNRVTTGDEAPTTQSLVQVESTLVLDKTVESALFAPRVSRDEGINQPVGVIVTVVTTVVTPDGVSEVEQQAVNIGSGDLLAIGDSEGVYDPSTGLETAGGAPVAPEIPPSESSVEDTVFAANEAGATEAPPAFEDTSTSAEDTVAGDVATVGPSIIFIINDNGDFLEVLA